MQGLVCIEGIFCKATTTSTAAGFDFFKRVCSNLEQGGRVKGEGINLRVY